MRAAAGCRQCAVSPPTFLIFPGRKSRPKNLRAGRSFTSPAVTVPRFTVAHPEIQIKDELYEGTDVAKLLSERTYDLIVTPKKIQSHGIESQSFLPDQVFLSVPAESKLAGLDRVSLKDIPEQPLLYPQIGGHFLSQIEKIITHNGLYITLVKNDYNITQHLIRTTSFLFLPLFLLFPFFCQSQSSSAFTIT